MKKAQEAPKVFTTRAAGVGKRMRKKSIIISLSLARSSSPTPNAKKKMIFSFFAACYSKDMHTTHLPAKKKKKQAQPQPYRLTPNQQTPLYCFFCFYHLPRFAHQRVYILKRFVNSFFLPLLLSFNSAFHTSFIYLFFIFKKQRLLPCYFFFFETAALYVIFFLKKPALFMLVFFFPKQQLFMLFFF